MEASPSAPISLVTRPTMREAPVKTADLARTGTCSKCDPNKHAQNKLASSRNQSLAYSTWAITTPNTSSHFILEVVTTCKLESHHTFYLTQVRVVCSLTNIPSRGLHGGNLAPNVRLDLILLCRSQDGLAAVPSNSIDGIEGDARHCIPHVLYRTHTEVHAWGEHVGNWCPSG